MKHTKKKEIRKAITAKIKPSILKDAEKKAEIDGDTFSRIVEKSLQEYVKKPT